MKTRKIAPLMLTAALLVGCTTRNPDYFYTEFHAASITSTGTYAIRADGTGIYAPLFNTDLSLRVYHTRNQYSKDVIDAIGNQFRYDMSYYHALTDRHYSYVKVDDQGTKTPIVGVKAINESYGTDTPVVVDSFLYGLLKKAYDFTLISEGRYNLFLGTINDLYEEKLDSLSRNITTLDYALTAANGFRFSQDVDADEVRRIVGCLPKTAEDFRDLLTFDDTDHSVTFHRFDKALPGYEPQISLGGSAKGFATEALAESLEKKYPDMVFMLDSGSSSFKTVGTKANGTEWNLLYRNSVYGEALKGKVNSSSVNPYNEYEVGLGLKKAFNLSTSGYDQNHFYVYDKTDGSYHRRDHIINPLTGYSTGFFDQVSVLNNDAGIADMYTTALMTADGVDEASELFRKWNAYYQDDTAQLILCFKSRTEDRMSHYSYSNSELSPLSDKNLPILEAEDKTRYDGDYSDLSLEQAFEMTCVTAPQRQFRMTYLMTPDLYKNAYRKATDMTKTDISVVGELTV